jgi:AraC family transcriptional regulator, arabinose operon regulatory protein
MKWKLVQGHIPRAVYGGSFDEGPAYSNWRPKGSGDCLLILTLKGRGWVGNESGQEPVSPGEVVLFEQHAEQVYYTDPKTGRWVFLWCHFLPKQGWSHGATWPEVAPGIRRLALASEEGRKGAKAGLSEMIRWVRQPDPMAGEFALNALEHAFLWMDREQQSRDLPRMDERIRSMMQILASEVDRPFDLASSARAAGMSVSRFAHLFREQAGRSPQQYTEDQKMRHAAQLLRLTSQSVGDIARSCGYDNAFYFSSRFRKWAQLSPREFRKQNAAG